MELMMLNKSKLPTLVKKTAPMPMPGGLKKKFMPGAMAPAAAMPAVAKPPPPQIDETQLPELVEQAAQAAEAGQDHELEDHLVDYMNGDQTQPPEWATDHEMWQKAANAVGLGTEEASMRYEEPYVVTAYLYRLMGGELGQAPMVDPAMGEAGEGMHPEPHAEPHPAPVKPPVAAKPPAKPAPAAKPPAAQPVDDASKTRAMAGKLSMAKKGAPAPAAKPPASEGTKSAAGGEDAEMVSKAAEEAKTNPDPELVQQLQSYDPQRDGDPPHWAEQPDLWGKAKAAVHQTWDQHDQPYLVVAHAYKALGGTIKKAASGGDMTTPKAPPVKAPPK